MKFKAHYNKHRFRYFGDDLLKTGLFEYCGDEKLRKTATFYGDKFNVYIDTSDGVNEDLDIPESCGRSKAVIKECDGKPFLFFKSFSSKVRSRNIIDLVSKNNGTFLPFFIWSPWNKFYSHLLKNRESLINLDNKTDKLYDIFMSANLEPYKYPKPNKSDPSITWRDYEIYGLGSPENTGYYEMTTRRDFFKTFRNSRFKFFHVDKMDYKEFLKLSFTSKIQFSPAGNSEYTTRMFDHSCLGQCVVIRKNTYDFYHSWKQYIPEVDFSKSNWEDDFQNIIDNHKFWGEKCRYYFDTYLSPKNLVNVIVKHIEEFNA